MQGRRTAKAEVNTRRRKGKKRIIPPAGVADTSEQEVFRSWVERADTRQRLDNLVRYVNHVERAYRKEESALLARQFSEHAAADFLMSQEQSSTAKGEWGDTKARLSRMGPEFELYHGMVMRQRVKEFRRRQAESAKNMAEEKAVRIRLREQQEREARELAAQAEMAARRAREVREGMVASESFSLGVSTPFTFPIEIREAQEASESIPFEIVETFLNLSRETRSASEVSRDATTVGREAFISFIVDI